MGGRIPIIELERWLIWMLMLMLMLIYEPFVVLYGVELRVGKYEKDVKMRNARHGTYLNATRPSNAVVVVCEIYIAC